jgi:segregation and condensation protein B
MALRPGFRDVRERLHGGQREARLSPPALDTLALVAYRQPVTRQEVDSLRGADSQALLRQLVRLGLVAVQRGDAGQKEVAYGTTSRFLRLFGLRGLDDLPRTQDLQKL